MSISHLRGIYRTPLYRTHLKSGGMSDCFLVLRQTEEAHCHGTYRSAEDMGKRSCFHGVYVIISIIINFFEKKLGKS